MDIREKIIQELTRRHKSWYWLGMKAKRTCQKCGHHAVENSDPKAHKTFFKCQACGFDKPVADYSTIMRYLRGSRDTSGELIGFILNAIGLKIGRYKRKRPEPALAGR